MKWRSERKTRFAGCPRTTQGANLFFQRHVIFPTATKELGKRRKTTNENSFVFIIRGLSFAFSILFSSGGLAQVFL
jgi:hypothetical protein